MATDKAQEPGGKGLFTKANLKAFLLVNLGVLLLTVGVYFFKLPNNFTTGGVSGLAILLSSVIPFLSTATLMGIINVLLLVLGYLFLGKEFGFWTTYCSKALFVSDSVIALAACFFFGIETGMFSLLGLFLKAFVVDSVIESINLCKFFSIVTSKPDEICDFIIKDLHHSSTVVDGQGAFSHQDRKVVLTAVRRGEAVRLRQKCKEIDPHSFMFITNTSEIIGKGFRSD